MLETISVAVMLARMEITYNDTGPVLFKLEFVKDDGTIRKMNAQNHVKNAAISRTSSPTSNFKYNLKKKGVLLLFDVDKRQYRTVRIDRIILFNNLIVQH